MLFIWCIGMFFTVFTVGVIGAADKKKIGLKKKMGLKDQIILAAILTAVVVLAWPAFWGFLFGHVLLGTPNSKSK